MPLPQLTLDKQKASILCERASSNTIQEIAVLVPCWISELDKRQSLRFGHIWTGEIGDGYVL